MRQILAVLITVSLCSCAAGRAGSGGGTHLDIDIRNSPVGQMDADVERSSQAMHHYMLGELYYSEQNFEQAISNLSKASELQSGDGASLHSRLAELHIRAGDLENALAESEKALKSSEPNARQLLVHAGILESLKRFDGAEPIYNQVIDKWPETMEAYILLAGLYSKTGAIAKSIAVLEKLVRRTPGDPTAYYYLAHAHESSGDYPQAEKYMIKAHEITPANTDLLLERVRILLKARKFEQSKKLLNDMLEKDPQHIVARRVIGQIMIGENRLDEALRHLQVLESIEQDSADTRFKIALIHLQQQNFKEAVSQLNLVLAGQPAHEEARYYLATALAAGGRNKEALEALEKIEKDSKMFGKARMFAGFILRQEGDLAGAEEAARDALEAEPDSKRTLAYLVLVLREARKFEEAMQILEDALKQDPGNDRLLFQYGVVLHDLGRDADSVAQMERVLKLNPKHSDALNYVAYNLAETGADLDRALKLVRKALEIKPNDGYYLDTLGWIYFISGKLADAESVLSQAVNASDGDVVIMEHYADCLVRLQKLEKAVQIYSSASVKGQSSDSSEDKEALKRIEEKISAIIASNPGLRRLLDKTASK